MNMIGKFQLPQNWIFEFFFFLIGDTLVCKAQYNKFCNTNSTTLVLKSKITNTT